MSSHPLRHPTIAAIAWPTYTGGSTLVGTSASGVSVYYDARLGAAALQNAQYLLNDSDRVVAFNSATFGTPTGPVNVILFDLNGLTNGQGGADHDGCDFNTGGNIEVDVSFGSSSRCSALFEAELSECMMNGRLCGLSTGEALSRWCAMAVSNNALADFATAPQWAKTLKNFVDVTAQTDGNSNATGCGMAFISWLIAAGLPLAKIAPAMVSLGNSGTLAELYAALTGNPIASAWPTFLAAVKALPGGVTSDDPFAGSAPPPPPPPPPPTEQIFTIKGTLISTAPA